MKKHTAKIVEVPSIWGTDLLGLMARHNKWIEQNAMKVENGGLTSNQILVLDFHATDVVPTDSSALSRQMQALGAMISKAIAEAVEKAITAVKK